MNERDLIERCKAGDEVAWGRLYQEFGPVVMRFVDRMLGHGGTRAGDGSSSDRDDVTQQVFVEVFVSLGRFRGDSAFATWLYGIAARVTLHHLRSQRRSRRRVDAWTVVANAIGETATDIQGQAEARADLRAVAAAAAELAPDLRAVWVMRELEGLSTAEVAAALDTREGTVRSRLFTARREVMAALESAARAPRAGAVPMGLHADEISRERMGVGT